MMIWILGPETGEEVGMATQKELLKKLQVLCEFCQKEGATGVDVEYVFQVLEEPKDDRIWEPSEVRVYQEALRSSLRFVSMATTIAGSNMEVEPPRRWHQLVNDGEKVRLVTRRTTSRRGSS
jgi:hypothetical protein